MEDLAASVVAASEVKALEDVEAALEGRASEAEALAVKASEEAALAVRASEEAALAVKASEEAALAVRASEVALGEKAASLESTLVV